MNNIIDVKEYVDALIAQGEKRFGDGYPSATGALQAQLELLVNGNEMHREIVLDIMREEIERFRDEKLLKQILTDTI